VSEKRYEVGSLKYEVKSSKYKVEKSKEDNDGERYEVRSEK